MRIFHCTALQKLCIFFYLIFHDIKYFSWYKDFLMCIHERINPMWKILYCNLWYFLSWIMAGRNSKPWVIFPVLSVYILICTGLLLMLLVKLYLSWYLNHFTYSSTPKSELSKVAEVSKFAIFNPGRNKRLVHAGREVLCLAYSTIKYLIRNCIFTCLLAFLTFKGILFFAHSSNCAIIKRYRRAPSI